MLTVQMLSGSNLLFWFLGVLFVSTQSFERKRANHLWTQLKHCLCIWDFLCCVYEPECSAQLSCWFKENKERWTLLGVLLLCVFVCLLLLFACQSLTIVFLFFFAQFMGESVYRDSKNERMFFQHKYYFWMRSSQ